MAKNPETAADTKLPSATEADPKIVNVDVAAEKAPPASTDTIFGEPIEDDPAVAQRWLRQEMINAASRHGGTDIQIIRRAQKFVEYVTDGSMPKPIPDPEAF